MVQRTMRISQVNSITKQGLRFSDQFGLLSIKGGIHKHISHVLILYFIV